MPTFFIIAVLAMVVLVVLAKARAAQRLAPMPFAPTNDLERQMLAAAQAGSITPELVKALRASTVIALEPLEGDPAAGPMTFHVDFAASGQDERFGPWLICWTSSKVAAEVEKDPVGGPVAKLGKLREYPGEAVVRRAVEEDLPLVLNAFTSLSCRLTPDQLR